MFYSNDKKQPAGPSQSQGVESRQWEHGGCLRVLTCMPGGVEGGQLAEQRGRLWFLHCTCSIAKKPAGMAAVQLSSWVRSSWFCHGEHKQLTSMEPLHLFFLAGLFPLRLKSWSLQ